ncbi:MAG: hypothetical protein AB1554_07770 [Chloroflexota bacterium]
MKTKLLSFVLVLIFALAACAPAATPTVAPPAPKPTDTPAANFPAGKFIKEGTTDYGLKFNADGTFWVFEGDIIFVRATYKVEGNIFTETSNDGGCDTNVSFTYAFDGANLTFNYVGNPNDDKDCTGRYADFNGVSYTLAEESAAAALPEIKVDAADYSYTAPETVDSGWTRVILTNTGAEPHHVQFLRLNDGVTAEQFEEALKQGEGPALALTQQIGGVGAVHPGGTASAVLNLTAGEYVILCLIPSPSDGMAHHAKGMIRRLTVNDADGHGMEPAADLTVNLKDFTFDMPASLASGPLTIKVTNDGPEPHEFNILKLEEGKTAADVMVFLGGQAGGPPPFAPVGGANGIDAGLTEYAELDLPPGNYVAICNIPSPKAEGHPHFTLGMIKEFTVTGATSNFPAGKFIKTGTTNYGLMFNADGTFYVFEGDNIFVRGTYSVDGNTFTETSNDGGCGTDMAFTYAFDGTNLTFNYVGNPDDDVVCTGRHADFNNVTYTLSN